MKLYHPMHNNHHHNRRHELFERTIQAREEIANEYIKRRGYVVWQDNGQRHCLVPGLPPPTEEWCEIFIGHLPRDCFEDELIPVFERAGQIYKIRLMMDFGKTNRGFGFIQYTTPQAAVNATVYLNDFLLRGHRLGVLVSLDNKRLFVGNLPPELTPQGLKRELEKHCQGIEDVQFENKKNKPYTYAIVKFTTHEAATKARRVLVPVDVYICGRQLKVDWAKPPPDLTPTLRVAKQLLDLHHI